MKGSYFLIKDQVDSIRRDPRAQHLIAYDYKISQKTVSDIKLNKIHYDASYTPERRAWRYPATSGSKVSTLKDRIEVLENLMISMIEKEHIAG